MENGDEDGNELLQVKGVLPFPYCDVFPYENFNHMQSLLLPQTLNTNLNMVIAAPTGCGKTVVHEIAIMRLMMKRPIKSIKIVYIAPNKALCQQKLEEWNKKFVQFGLSVLEVTGDVDLKHCIRLIAKATIIITTPEKWDSLTRSWKDHLFLLGAVDLLLLDEVHHLGEDRGSTLEIVVVRMRVLNRTCMERIKQHNEQDDRESMRIIALSATLPNLADIGDWIGCGPQSVHYFDETFRPVPLTIHTLAMGSMNNPFLFERSLDDKVGDVVQRFSEGKQTLVFCSSKKSAELLTGILARRFGRRAQRQQEVLDRTYNMQDAQLRELVLVGCAYHHSGLPPDDRLAVEQLYLTGHIHVLCSTSTLAHGVNLPAHLVVIKGTNCWRGGSRGYEKMCRSEIIQMLGRAGRPGFDTHGVAVVMTSNQDRDFYANISLHAEVVESTLQGILVEAICSEISQQVVRDVPECLQWLKSTFFYVRVRKNPVRYGFPQAQTPDQLEQALTDICIRAIKQLAESHIVTLDDEGLAVSPCVEAHVMTRSLVKFETMKLLIHMPPNNTLQQFLKVFSHSKELDKPVRKAEKRVLNDLMKAVRFPLRERVQDPWQKAYLLMQVAVSRLDMKDFSLKVEQSEIVECALRVLGAMTELCKERNRGQLLESALLLDRALRCRMWEHNYGSVFMQCEELSDTTRGSLVERGVRVVADVEGCSPTKVQSMAQCTAVEARAILHFARLLRVTRLSLKANKAGQTLNVTVDPADDLPPDWASVPLESYPSFHLLCYDTRTSETLCYRKLSAVNKHNAFSVPFKREGGLLEEVRCSLICSLVGNDCSVGAAVNATTNTTPLAPPKVPKPRVTAAVTSTSTAEHAPSGSALPATRQKRVSPVTAAEPHAPQTLFSEVQPTQSRVTAEARRKIPAFEQTLLQFSHPVEEPDVLPPQRRTQLESNAPFGDEVQEVSKVSGSGLSNPYAPFISKDLSVLRAKASELQLDRNPLKRMRPAVGKVASQSIQVPHQVVPLSDCTFQPLNAPTPDDNGFGGPAQVSPVEDLALHQQGVERLRPVADRREGRYSSFFDSFFDPSQPDPQSDHFPNKLLHSVSSEHMPTARNASHSTSYSVPPSGAAGRPNVVDLVDDPRSSSTASSGPRVTVRRPQPVEHSVKPPAVGQNNDVNVAVPPKQCTPRPQTMDELFDASFF